MRLKSLMLASAASLLAMTAISNAADMVLDPVEAAPAPVSPSGSVAVCDAAGVGYFFIPGTQTCLRVGGAVEATVGYVKVGDDSTWAGVEARMDLDTHTDSEIGAIGSKFRVSFKNPTLLGGVSTTGDQVGVELAYITVGPAFVGYKESLFDARLGYGTLFDVDTYVDTNTLTAGFVADIEGGYYAGLAVEGSNRNRWLTSYESGSDVDVAGKIGVVQGWGSSDLSGIYFGNDDAWALKSTTDVKVLASTDLRFVGAYGQSRVAEGTLLDSDASGYLLTAGVKHGVTDKVSAFGTFGYGSLKFDSNVAPVSVAEDGILANAGVTYTPVEGFDVTGELGYAKADSEDAYATTVKFSKSW